MITFREVLKSREAAGQTTLFTALERMHSEALNSWLSQLGEDKQSYTGIPHLQNVEKHIDHLVPERIKQGFSSTEIFVLLAAVLLHDLGKLTIKTHEPDETKKKDLAKKFHAVYSCLSIQKNWGFLAIPHESLARHIAIITCAHVWQDPVPLKELDCQDDIKGGRKYCHLLCQPGEMPYSEINLLPMADDGPVRLDWLAALLRLGDVVDNCASRVVPSWVILSEPPGAKGTEDQEAIKHWRNLLSAIEFDLTGKCIRLLSTSFSLEVWSKSPPVDPIAPFWRVMEALDDINAVLDHWGHILKEMDLGYERSLLDFAAPVPVLVGREQSVPLQAMIEPALALSPKILALVQEAMFRLHRSVIKAEAFSWDALASESGVNDLPLVRLAAYRIRALTMWHKWRRHHLEESLIFADLPDSYNAIDLEELQIISSSTSWRLKRNDDQKAINMSPPRTAGKHPDYIPTRTPELDLLLCPEPPDEQLQQKFKPGNNRPAWPGGIYAPLVAGEPSKWISPIIVVEGSSGVGKTILSLQIACRLADSKVMDRDGKWACIYYSLEQSPERIAKNIEIFKAFQSNDQDAPALKPAFFEDERWNAKPLRDYPWPMLLPRITPRFPGQDAEGNRNTFDQRYSDLKCALEWLGSRPDQEMEVFFFIDSISAFANNPLSRDEVHRLFHLFRLHEVPLLVTLERQTQWSDDRERIPYNVTRYLADIVIQLERAIDDSGYYKQTIEVAKTRYNRRILGRHLMKLKSPHRQTTAPFDTRSGVVIYPSIHYHLTKNRSTEEPSQNINIIETDGNYLSVGYRKRQTDGKEKYGVDSNSCIVISGQHGSHKFALGLNLLLNIIPEQFAPPITLNELEIKKAKAESLRPPDPIYTEHRRRLIVSLTEERSIDLHNVALLKPINYQWQAKLKAFLSKDPELKRRAREAKIWEQHFGEIRKPDDKMFAYITVLNFRMGQIMPEEFLYLFENYLRENKSKGSPFDAVLFWNTADLRTRFPFLKADPLFMPTLCDVIKEKGIYSIFIDVVDDEEKRNEALLAAADCRIYIEQAGEKKEEKKQVRFYIHNVRGKEYDQGPYYITFPPDQPDQEKKLMEIGKKYPGQADGQDEKGRKR